jgi:hypothetical protein
MDEAVSVKPGHEAVAWHAVPADERPSPGQVLYRSMVIPALPIPSSNRLFTTGSFTPSASTAFNSSGGAITAGHPPKKMVAWPVSARVGNVKNNDSSLIKPNAAKG